MDMEISRRSFLKYCISSAAALGLSSSVVFKMTKALAGDLTMPTVIWIEGSSCSGCSTSLLNLISNSSDGGPADAADLLITQINLVYSQVLMSAPGDLAVSNLRAAQQKEFILIVEGGIPTAFNGTACTVFSENGSDVTMMQLVNELAPLATAILCVGTCASFGGIPAASPNPTIVKTVKQLTGVSTINLPGCPAHPDWMAGAIATLLCSSPLPTDSKGRPTAFFGRTVHSQCPKKPSYDHGNFADDFGQEGRCLNRLGCVGPSTYADCPVRGWNNGFNYCMNANGNCIGCVESNFPLNPMIIRP
jgi:hydrogenase small subunit